MGRVIEQKINGASNRIKEDIQQIKEFLEKDFGDEKSWHTGKVGPGTPGPLRWDPKSGKVGPLRWDPKSGKVGPLRWDPKS